jgi:hypothetical protein
LRVHQRPLAAPADTVMAAAQVKEALMASHSRACDAASGRRILVVGRCRTGAWVVRSPDGPIEAIFSARSDAIRFARTQDGEERRAVILAPYATP